MNWFLPKRHAFPPEASRERSRNCEVCFAQKAMFRDAMGMRQQRVQAKLAQSIALDTQPYAYVLMQNI